MEIRPIVKDDFIVLTEDATLSEMMGKLKQFEKRSCLIFRNNKYLGLIEKKKLLQSRLDPTGTKIKGHVKRTPVLNENAEVIDTAYLMFESNLDFLPVEKDKEIVGVVEGLDIASLALTLPEVKKFKIKDLKLLKSIHLNKDDPISMAIDMMHDEHVDQVPILDKGKLYGIITYRDLFRKFLNWSPKRDVSAKFNKLASSRSAEVDFPHMASMPVSSFSTTDNLIVVSESESLKNALTLMLKNRVSALLVLEGTEFIGLLSTKNILRAIGSLKIPQKFNIQYVGLRDLDLSDHEQTMLKKICSNESIKLQRLVHNEFSLIIHFKEYQKGGKQKKFSVHMRVEYPGKIVTVSQDDWDFETALHKAFDSAKNALLGKFRPEPESNLGWERTPPVRGKVIKKKTKRN